MKTMLIRLTSWCPCALATMMVVAISAPTFAGDPDCVYSDCTDVSHYGPVGSKHAYSLGTATCNIGSVNMHWTNSGSPALAMNMYRLKDGRLMQIGLGFCKTACCAAAGNQCGLSCNGTGGQWLGAGCRDVYGSGYNAIQTKLAPRSALNPTTGAFTSFPATSGDAIFRRLQVEQADLDPALNPNSLYFIEGQYITDDDIPAGRGDNNASYRRVTITAGTYAASVQGSMAVGSQAIQAWRDHGLGVGVPDTSVTITPYTFAGAGQISVGHKATSLGGGQWRYDYAIHNFSLDKAVGGFSIPIPLGAPVSDIGFHDVDYHSGELYANTDWTSTVTPGWITWSSPQTHAQNVNSNAIRWGTMYNFWFVTNRPPVSNGAGTVTLFKPHTPQSANITMTVPRPCQMAGDISASDGRNGADVTKYLDCVGNHSAAGADCDCADLDNNNQIDAVDTQALVDLLLAD